MLWHRPAGTTCFVGPIDPIRAPKSFLTCVDSKHLGLVYVTLKRFHSIPGDLCDLWVEVPGSTEFCMDTNANLYAEFYTKHFEKCPIAMRDALW